MMTEHDRLPEKLNDHERSRELAALANSGTLTDGELAELKGHLQVCQECREVYDQFLILAKKGIPLLAPRYNHRPEQGSWDDRTTRSKLFARIRAAQQLASPGPAGLFPAATPLHTLRRIAVGPLVRATLAACLVVAIGVGAYRLGSWEQLGGEQTWAKLQASAEGRFVKLAAEKKLVDEMLDAQTKKLFQLQDQSSQKEEELTKLRVALRTMEDRTNKLRAAKTTTEQRVSELMTAGSAMKAQLRTVCQQRDALSAELQDAEKAYEKVQVELTILRADRDKAILQTASLESRIEELSDLNRDRERRLSNQEQYLASDRDIRELMGARHLYIADVFDVSSDSRTRKPFGRVFYTQGKSLIFYAFDLDRQAGIMNTSSFQAWGRKESDQGNLLNLGILYLDNEANRRWVLRCDDPKQLAEIDAVFITVEPHGGSQKPTGKPYLYALLRREANHP